MKKIALIISTLFLAASLFSGQALAADRIFFGIATGGTGGTYYPLGGMLAQMIFNRAIGSPIIKNPLHHP